MPEHASLHVRCRAALGALRFDVDFTTASAWTVLFGPSGSGKSSLLRLVAGLWMPGESEVHFGEQDVTRTPADLRGCGFVAQEPALFPHMDVLANVRFGCKRQEVADAMLSLFHLQDLRHARIRTLSGGEQQRVALARALAAEPRLLLLDEVFTGMHLHQRDELLQRVCDHCRTAGMPVLSVTHDALEACMVPGEALKLEAGRLTAQGTSAAVLAPERDALRVRLSASLPGAG